MGPPSHLFTELSRWRDKATKRGKTTHFNSDIIPDWLNIELVAAQEAVGPEAAFSFLKQVPLSVRMKAEREIKRKVQAILGKYESRAARSIKRGEEFDYAGMADELRAAVMPEVSSLVLDSALRLSVDTGISFDPAVINTEALRWAREYSYELVTGLTNTTRNQISEATSAFVQTPGMTVGDIQKLIEPSFGAVRAQMIAVTETTRAYSMGTNEIQKLLQQETPELSTTLVLNTMQDELVCPICGPLEGAPKSEWGNEFPSGPPLHVNCRCSSSIRFETPEQLEAEFGERQAEREAWLREQGLWVEPTSVGAIAPAATVLPIAEEIIQVETLAEMKQRAIDAGMAQRINLNYINPRKEIHHISPEFKTQVMDSYTAGWQQMADKYPRLTRAPVGEVRAFNDTTRDYYGRSYDSRKLESNVLELNQIAFEVLNGEPTWFEKRNGYKIIYDRDTTGVVRHELGHALFGDWYDDMKQYGGGRQAAQIRAMAAWQKHPPELWAEQLGQRASKDWREWVADALSAYADPAQRVTLPDDTISFLEDITK